jgi:transcriptional regulator with XRE-family HTH domain
MSRDRAGLAAARFRLLLQQLLSEEGATQESVAYEIGVSQPLVSSVLSGARRAGARAIARAIAALTLDPRFFYDAGLKSPHYGDHLHRDEPDEDESEVFQSFRQSYPRVAWLSDKQMRYVKSAPFRGGKLPRSWLEFAKIADVLLDGSDT